jgi:hypothetical protein
MPLAGTTVLRGGAKVGWITVAPVGNVPRRPTRHKGLANRTVSLNPLRAEELEDQRGRQESSQDFS